MFDLIYKRGCKKVQGVRVLGYSISTPDFKEFPKISEFYSEISTLVTQRCEGELANHAEEDYLTFRRTDVRAEFLPTLYSLSSEVTHFDGDTLFVKLVATLNERGRYTTKTVIEAHAWSVDDQMLMPPRQAARRFIPRGRIPLMMGYTGFLVDNGKYYLCRDNQLLPISISKTKKQIK